MHYEINIAGVRRRLPLCPINNDLQIGAFIMVGDVELTVHCAKELLKIAPDYDFILTAETKGIPLAAEMARQHGDDFYIVARKSPKLYMSDILEVTVKSITTAAQQKLLLDGHWAAKMRGRKILIVDDVISTGRSLLALEELVEKAGGKVCGSQAVLAEGEAIGRSDIQYLQKLPLFDAQGRPLP